MVVLNKLDMRANRGNKLGQLTKNPINKWDQPNLKNKWDQPNLKNKLDKSNPKNKLDKSNLKNKLDQPNPKNILDKPNPKNRKNPNKYHNQILHILKTYLAIKPIQKGLHIHRYNHQK